MGVESGVFREDIIFWLLRKIRIGWPVFAMQTQLSIINCVLSILFHHRFYQPCCHECDNQVECECHIGLVGMLTG